MEFEKVFTPKSAVEAGSISRIIPESWKEPLLDEVEAIVQVDKLKFFTLDLDTNNGMTVGELVGYGRMIGAVGSFGLGAHMRWFESEYANHFFPNEEQNFDPKAERSNIHSRIILPRTILVDFMDYERVCLLRIIPGQFIGGEWFSTVFKPELFYPTNGMHVPVHFLMQE